MLYGLSHAPAFACSPATHVPVCRNAKAAANGAPAMANRVSAQRIRNGVAKGTKESGPALAAATPADKIKSAPTAAPSAETAPAQDPAAPPRTATAAIDEQAFSKAYASPSVRKFARELGVNLAQVAGHGFKDRITHEDVKAFVKAALAAPATAAAPAAAAAPAGGALPAVRSAGSRCRNMPARSSR